MSIEKDSISEKMRARAYTMVFQGKKNAEILRITGVSNGKFCRIKQAHLSNDDKTLEKLSDPENNSAGASLRLSKSTELRIWAGIKHAAERRFAFNVEVIRDIAARNAEENGN